MNVTWGVICVVWFNVMYLKSVVQRAVGFAGCVTDPELEHGSAGRYV